MFPPCSEGETDEHRAPNTDPAAVKLNDDLKAAWTQALRSGEYAQCKGFLYINGDEDEDPGYCCLGVLAFLAGKSTIQLCGEHYLDDVGLHSLIGSRSASEEEIGLILGKAWTYNASPQMMLSEMNDSGKSFSSIADWIDANL